MISLSPIYPHTSIHPSIITFASPHPPPCRYLQHSRSGESRSTCPPHAPKSPPATSSTTPGSSAAKWNSCKVSFYRCLECARLSHWRSCRCATKTPSSPPAWSSWTVLAVEWWRKHTATAATLCWKRSTAPLRLQRMAIVEMDGLLVPAKCTDVRIHPTIARSLCGTVLTRRYAAVPCRKPVFHGSTWGFSWRGMRAAIHPTLDPHPQVATPDCPPTFLLINQL